ncbi:MAG: chromate efflux transporter [Elusimicrobia bacterium]|nr:chromate efflux transporter [Elusimicrobiota bacterium]
MTRFLSYFLRLGTVGFGGPIALANAMERDLVAERGWISAEDYRQGLALSQLAPGPLAAQLAMYLGYVRAGTMGAALAGIAFVTPSFLMVIAIAWAYVRFNGLPWMQSVFYGVGAAVIALMAKAAYALTRKTLGQRPLLWVIWGFTAAATVILRREVVWFFFLAGAIGVAAEVRPRGQLLAADPGTLWTVLLFFTKAGAFVFGSGLAIVPFLYGGAVVQHHWLTERQFLDAVAVAMITPGPVVITVAFIGYLVAGLPGSCAAATGVFLPPWLFVVALAGWFRRRGADPRLQGFVDGVTAAAVGALTGAALILARGSIKDVPTALIAAAALFAVTRRKIPEPLVVAAAAAVGLLLGRG